MILKRLLFRMAYYPAIACLKPINCLHQPIYNQLIYSVLKWGGVKFKGFPRYISSDVYLDQFNLITIGEQVVISKKVTFLTHDYSITTALYQEWGELKKEVKIDGPITIEENVFIGLGTLLLPGTHIGKNTIIGAGSVVKGRIPENSVAAGNPCKVIMTLQEYLSKKRSNSSIAEQIN